MGDITAEAGCDMKSKAEAAISSRQHASQAYTTAQLALPLNSSLPLKIAQNEKCSL